MEQLSRRLGELQELLAERDGKLESLAKDLEQQGKERTKMDNERSVMLQYINEESGTYSAKSHYSDLIYQIY